MFKKFKTISILTIVIFYILQLCIVFSGALIDNIQQIRHQNQISKFHLAEEKIVTFKEWIGFENKKEININGVFYDVVYFKKHTDKMVLKVVKDNFESELRISMQNLFNKKNVPETGKKKGFNYFNYLSNIEKHKYDYNRFAACILLSSNYYYIQIKTNKISSSIYRPPC